MADYHLGMRFVLVGALFLALAGSAHAALFMFRTPSSNIGCLFSSEPGFGGPYLRCDILSGLKPAPKRPKGCTLDWKYGYRLRPTGPALTVCAGDTAPVIQPPSSGKIGIRRGAPSPASRGRPACAATTAAATASS